MIKENVKKRVKSLKQELKLAKKNKNINLAIRIMVLIAFYDGKPKNTICEYYNISKKTLGRWIKRYESKGINGLNDEVRSGRPVKLTDLQLQELKKAITDNKNRVWVARHIYNLIITMFSVIYSVKYLPEILKRIGLSFKKAMHYLAKRNEDERSKWIKEKLPKIYEEHIKNGTRIFFQDEVGFQTEGTLSYSWFLQEEKPEIKNYGRHGRVNMLGVYEVGTGDFFGKTTTLKVNALRFKRFLCCLKKRYRNDKIIIILDNAKFHHAKILTEWLNTQNWISLEFLPAYSPDFNPIERMWKWIKKEYTHNKCWESKEELHKHLTETLCDLHKEQKENYIGTMRSELLRLKAAFEFYNTPFIWQNQLDLAA